METCSETELERFRVRPSPCVSHEFRQCRQKSLPRLLPFLVFTTIAKSALSEITIVVTIYSVHTQAFLPSSSSFPRPLGPLPPHLQSRYRCCCPRSNSFLRCLHLPPPLPFLNPFHVAVLPVVVVLISTIEVTVAVDVPVVPSLRCRQ